MKDKNTEQIKRRIPITAAIIAILAVAAAALVILNNSGENTENDIPAQPQTTANKQSVESSITVFYDRTDERTSDNVEDFRAEDDCTYSWEINDAEKIEAAKNWLEEFENTHEASAEPLGYEVSVDRYKFEIGGREVKLNYYDSTAVVIDDSYYTGTTAGDLAELLPLICEDTSIINVYAGRDGRPKNWTIDDAETVTELVETIAHIEDTTEPETGYPAMGGSAPHLNYVYNGRLYNVHVRPNKNELFITVNDSKDGLSYFPDDKNAVQEIFDSVLNSEP